MVKAIVIIVLLSIVGVWATIEPKAPQPKTSILPLHDHLIQIPPNWKEAYGDTLETRIIYNVADLRSKVAILQSNQMEIAKMIQKMHPPIDPNEVK